MQKAKKSAHPDNHDQRGQEHGRASHAHERHSLDAEHRGEDDHTARAHGHGQHHAGAAHSPLADVGAIISYKKDDHKPDIHHQPKVAEHRGEMQRTRNTASVHQALADVKQGQGQRMSNAIDKAARTSTGPQKHISMQRSAVDLLRGDEDRRSLRRRSDSSSHSLLKDKDDDRSSTSGESDRSGGSVVLSKGDDDDSGWDIFEDLPGVEEDELEEKNPLYEMANVDIDVEDVLAEMETALRFALEQGRVSDRERIILLDKFGLFLQALVSFQENEVELIDHIGMKTQIMDVLQTFTADEDKATEQMLAEQKALREDTTGDLDTLSLSKMHTGTDEPPVEEVPESSGAGAIDEMNATSIRENLLLQKNKLEMQEQMKIIHILEIKQLEFEKMLLTMHYSKMIKPTDLQKEMRDLRKTITDMKIEIGTMQHEIAQLQLDIAAEEKVLKDEENDVNQLDLDTLSKQIEVTQNSSKPIHLQKDADREAHKLEQLQDILQDLEERRMAGMNTFRVFQVKIDSKNAEYTTMLNEESRMNQARKQTQFETDHLLGDIDQLQKKEQGLLNKSRVTIEKISYNVKLKKKLFEEHHSIYNETARLQREHQKLDRNIKSARESHLNAKLAHEKMRSAFDALQPKGDSDNWEKLRKMFLNEIENLKSALDKSLLDSSYQASAVINLQKQLNSLYEDQVNCGKELQNLMRTTVRNRRERQDKAEQCIKLEAQLFGIVTDIRMKKVFTEELVRNERDMNRNIALLQKQYSQVKIEKASVVNDLIQAKQRITEQTEKFKIANNEVESYVNQSLDREREITRIHYLLLNAGLARDSVRNDALRAVQKFRVDRMERDEMKMANENTRREIVRLRRDVADIRSQFEEGIETSAKLAIAVRERTEEVCTFIERIQAYDMILLNANTELRLRELEKTKLLSSLNEVKTHLIIVTSNEPDEAQFVEKIEALRLQLYAVTKDRRSLEDDLSNVTHPGRVREIHHNWIEEREQVPHLRKKINKLECLLATREVRILERALTLKQVEELTESSMDQASYLKERYECEVKHLVDMRKTLYHFSNRIDGMICEVSLAVSRAESSELAYMREKQELAIAQRRFKLGFPPTREILNLWNRKVWHNEMLTKARMRKTGFLQKKKCPSGSGVVMERYRPKPKTPSDSESLPVCSLPPIGPCRPKFPYKSKHRKLSCIKPVLPSLSTGLRVCGGPSKQTLKLQI